MIDVKQTLFETIKDKFFKMRFLGQFDSLTFKHILYLIVLDDLYDWSNYLDEKQLIQKRLQELRTRFILNHGEFIVKMASPNNFYVNVNTPQTNLTWRRVWDDPEAVTINSVSQTIDTTVNAIPFTPDPTCPVSLTYFGTGELIPADAQGKPSVDFDTLTICEKMNIYINRETGQMFFLDPQTCTWKTLKGEFASTVTWDSIIGAPKIYSNIEHSVDDQENEFNVTLGEAIRNSDGSWNYGNQTSITPVTDSNTDPDQNTDLNDIL